MSNNPKLVKQIIVVRKDLLTREDNRMTVGKLAGQVAHAAMAPILEMMRGVQYKDHLPVKGDDRIFLDMKEHSDIKSWLDTDFRKIILYVKTEEKLLSVYNQIREHGFIASLIEDNALTIFNEPTITCFGVEPLESSIIDPLTKRLRLLD